MRRYLRRAPAAYLLEGATYSRIGSTLTETVEGARTVEALGLQEERRRAAWDAGSPVCWPWPCSAGDVDATRNPTRQQNQPQLKYRPSRGASGAKS